MAFVDECLDRFEAVLGRADEFRITPQRALHRRAQATCFEQRRLWIRISHARLAAPLPGLNCRPCRIAPPLDYKREAHFRYRRASHASNTALRRYRRETPPKRAREHQP